MDQLPEKYRKLAKNPPCSSTKAVNCWYCGNAFSKKSNLKAHHETTKEARHLNKSMAYYIKGTIGFLAHPDPPLILGVSENVTVDQSAEIVDDSADSNQQAGSIQTEKPTIKTNQVNQLKYPENFDKLTCFLGNVINCC